MEKPRRRPERRRGRSSPMASPLPRIASRFGRMLYESIGLSTTSATDLPWRRQENEPLAVAANPSQELMAWRTCSIADSRSIPSSAATPANVFATSWIRRSFSARLGARGVLLTRVPCRPRVSMMPSSSSSRNALATVPGATPRSAASCRTVGRRLPSGRDPVATSRRIERSDSYDLGH